MTHEFIPCQIKMLSPEHRIKAAAAAIANNPANRPPAEKAAQLGIHQPDHLALLTTSYWGAKGVKLSVSFMESTPTDLRDRIILHANAWGKWSNVVFTWTAGQGQVRISRGQGGYWSYLGSDILQVPANEPTLNLQAFTMKTPDSEFYRVVRHEIGHTLGFPHEHLRKELLARLDVAKTLAYFESTQGWDEATVRSNVLTPLEDAALLSVPGSFPADQNSIMCYQLSGSITKDGKPIIGGTDIDAEDGAFAAKVYPLAVQPPPPSTGVAILFSGGLAVGTTGTYAVHKAG